MAINGLNDNSVQDVNKGISGKDGRLFVTNKSGVNVFLAEVDTFSVQINVTNVDWQPVGSILTFAVTTGCTVSLTFTETVVRDDILVTELLDDMRSGYFPSYAFQGSLQRRDNQRERIVFRNCVPDGTIDLMKVSPGELIKRDWSFRVNELPERLEHFITTGSWNPVN